MKSRMIKTTLFAAAVALLGGTATAHERSAEIAGSQIMAEGNFEAVKRIQTWGRLDDFRVIDKETLIVWATPFRPYLVKLSWPSQGLRFAQAIGVTSTNGAVTPFDSILVRGQRYPIGSIYRLDKAQAKALQAAS